MSLSAEQGVWIAQSTRNIDIICANHVNRYHKVLSKTDSIS